MPGNEPIFPIGARCVQAALERGGHRVTLMDFVQTPEALTNFAWAAQDWDVVGFAIRNIDPVDLACEGHVQPYGDFVDRVRSVLRPEALLVGGGPGYSLFAQSLTQRLRLNVGVRGPGEEVMLKIAANPREYAGGQTIVDGQRYDTFVREPLRHPEGLMRAYAVDGSSMIGVETRRKTCFQRCVYCPYAYITGQNSGDVKPLDVLRSEIQGIYDSGFRRIFFTDGIFNSGITHAKEIVRMLAEGAWPSLMWSAYFAAHPFDDEFAASLKNSGVESIVVSPDSLDDGLMKRLGKNFDLKAMDRFIETCRRHQLRLMVNVVFGGPGETRQTVRNTAHYINSSLESDELSMHVGYRVLPHTALSAETALGEESLLDPTFYPFDAELFHWLIQDLEARFMTPSRLMNLLAGRASVRRMARISRPQQKVASDSCATSVVAFTRSST